MKYKVGQRVRVKSLDWYNENKDEDGNIFFPLSTMTKAKSEWCGKVMTILSAHVDFYRMEEMGLTAINYWTDEMIEGLVEEDVDLIPKFGEYSDNEPLDMPTMTTEFVKEHGLPCPEGFIFKDENGNVINATKIVLEKKEKEYPKTYQECCKVMNYCCNPSDVKTLHKEELMRKFQFLILYRDAYRKIAGEEMGLGKPWEYDCNSGYFVPAIIYRNGYIQKVDVQYRNAILTFPTEEMRDAFKENFKELIEICKELL